MYIEAKLYESSWQTLDPKPTACTTEMRTVWAYG